MTQNQPKPDIRQLGQRDLPDTKFPAKADHFRVFLDPSVHEEIQKHARQNLSVEIGGVLVGGWEKDADGPFVAVRNVICSELAASGAGELTFTHDAWAEIHRVMDADYTDSSIVGWYHTHPDFGIFLSERDQFIHEHFFSDPGQIAYVVDPIRAQEGVFVWRGGKTALCQHYWVGDEIRTAPEKPEDRRERGQAKSANAADTTPVRLDPMRGDWLLISLLGVLFFLIGYLLADRKSAWEQSRLVDGVVAHFGTMKVLRPGLRQNLDIVAEEMEKLRKHLADVRPKEADGKATLTQAELDQLSQRIRQTRSFSGADRGALLLQRVGIGDPSQASQRGIRQAPWRPGAASASRQARGSQTDQERVAVAKAAFDTNGTAARIFSTAQSTTGAAVNRSTDCNSVRACAGKTPSRGERVVATGVMSQPNDPIRLDYGDLHSQSVESYLEVRRAMRQSLGEQEPQPLIIRVIYSSWFYLAIASALGAFVAWICLEPFFDDNVEDVGAVGFLLFPTVAGFIGLFLGAAEGLMCRNIGRAATSGVVGLLVGFAGGLILLIPTGIIFGITIEVVRRFPLPDETVTPTGFAFLILMMGRAAAWALVSIPAGLGQGIALREKKVILNGAVGGVLGGLLGGLLFDPISLLFMTEDGQAAASRAIGFVAIGLLVGLFVGLVESWTKTAWLHMRAGPLAGKQFVIHRDTTVLGSAPKADIYLFKDAAIEPRHAVIYNRGGRFEIEDCATGDGTYVNQLPIKRQVLKNGDQIILGETVLEFVIKESS